MTRNSLKIILYTICIYLCVVFVSGTCCAGRIFLEAEDMKSDTGSWAVKDHFSGWYAGFPSGGKMLSGGGDGAVQGEVRKSVDIPTSGTYRLWVRYLDGAYRGAFKICILQSGIQVAEKVFDAVSIRSTPQSIVKWGNGGYVFVWDSFDIQLKSGQTEIVLSKSEPIGTSWIARHIDCLLITDELNYTPNISDFLTPLYIKIKMGEKHKEPCVIHLWGRRPQDPWYMDHSNIWKDGIAIGQCYTGFAQTNDKENYLVSGSETPWIDIAPFLATMGDNRVQFTAMQEYFTGLPTSDFKVLISETPSDKGIINTFSRSGEGSGIMLVIDLMHRNLIRSDLDYSREALASAKRLSIPPGKRPTKFPIFTGIDVNPSFNQAEVVSNEKETLSILGFNCPGSADPVSFTLGGVSYFHLVDGCYSRPKIEEIRTAVIGSAPKPGAHPFATMLTDEPGSNGLDHIVKCPACIEKFREYLKKQNLEPSYFGKQSWEQINPTADSEKEARLYYFSVLFNCQILTDFFKLATDMIRTVNPKASTTANFAEENTYNGNALQRGVDWYAIQEQEALTFGWTEDWLSDSASKQLSGYRADLLRSACAVKKQSFGMYTIASDGWDTMLKSVTEIGHGATAIYHYNYGPYYSISPDPISNNYDLYGQFNKVNYAIGKVEDYLVGARVPKSKIGLVYSHSTDIWTIKEPHSLFGKERMGIYLILRHLGYPVDVVTEKQIALNSIKDYNMLIYVGSHTSEDVPKQLAAWVHSGGILYIGAGSLMQDQFNRPLIYDTMLGIKREAFVYRNSPGREYYDYQTLEKLDTVDYQGKKMDVVCGFQRSGDTAATNVLATFADGSPATQVINYGKGKIVSCGFFPGIAYCKEAITTLKKSNQTSNTSGATVFPEVQRVLFKKLLNLISWKPAVATSNHLVEANLLQSPKGCVVVLSNWSGKPIRNLVVSIAVPGKYNSPLSATGKVKSLKKVNNTLMVTMDIDTFDFLYFTAR